MRYTREGNRSARVREVACGEALQLVVLNEASRHPASKARSTPVGQGFVFGRVAPDELHLLRTLRVEARKQAARLRVEGQPLQVHLARDREARLPAPEDLAPTGHGEHLALAVRNAHCQIRQLEVYHLLSMARCVT